MRISRALGAEVVLVEQSPGSTSGHVTGDDLRLVEEAAARASSASEAPSAPTSSTRESNFRAHYLHTGPDFIRKTGGKIDAFCDLIGTGGSFAGVAAALKEHDPAIRYVVEPRGAEALAGCLVSCCSHALQGAGYGRTDLPLVRREYIDDFLAVSDEQATEAAHRLAREEGIFAGFTAGANVAAALELLRDRHKGQTVAVTIPDSGMKYFSTPLWA